jgi:glycosyltransferase involved in cell wall biosynthesis
VHVPPEAIDSPPRLTLEHEAMIGHYALPVKDARQSRPVAAVPAEPRRTALRWLGRARSGPGARRLAFLDSHFPWARSGFRYHEGLALLERRPDTLFFSTWEMTDPFPVPVQPIADFPRIALRAGITDVYAVFQLFLEGICGLGTTGDDGHDPHPIQGPDLWEFLRGEGIRVHGCVYPGGGFVDTAEGYERVALLASRLDRLLTTIPSILERVPNATYVPPAVIDTRFYAYSADRWASTARIECLFAADSPPRKGLDAALEAFGDLDGRFHLEVVGPHQHRRDELPADRATFHGWQSPEALRDLHRRTHVFLSPVRVEEAGPPGSHQGFVDGFPTTAALDAMASGCLLVSANPARDHRVFEPGLHYIECEPDAGAIRDALEAVYADPAAARAVAERGAARARARMDIRDGVEAKLAAIGLA